jgi:hypothetical protein
VARPKPSPELLAQYLDLISGGAKLGEAARAVGRTPETCQRWGRSDPSFQERVRLARIEAQKAETAQMADTSTPTPANPPATAAPDPPLPIVRPIAVGLLRDGVVYVEPGRFALKLAREFAQ